MNEDVQLEVEYRRLVLSGLEELQASQGGLSKAVVKLQIDVAVIKSKNAIMAAGFGLAGGVVGTVVAAMIIRAMA